MVVRNQRFCGLQWLSWLWFWSCSFRSFVVVADDCSGRPGTFYYNAERCYNSTHVLEQSGSCVNGVTNLDYAVFKQCENSDDPSKTGYCHECGATRLICSNSKKVHEACSDDNLNGICQESDTYALYWGCATQQYFFRTSQLCNSNDASSQTHSQQTCGGAFMGYDRCLACPGTQLCVSGDETCESLNMEQGLTHNHITPKTKAPSVAPVDDDGPGGVFNATENILYLPIDPMDHDYSCDSFRGDVNFYREECWNSTHTSTISGACINGALAFGSTAVSTCENVGPDLTYCHKCEDKLVCATSDDSGVVCNNALSDPPPCPATREAADDQTPMITSTFTGCFNETDYYYNYQYCGNNDQQQVSSAIYMVYDSQQAPCYSNYDGLDFCHSCHDGIQLCAREEGSACGIHDYKEELAQLESPLDCSQINGDIDFYKERCYNATHTVIFSGKCVNGKMTNEVGTINQCEDSGAGQTYCHECAHSHLVCSQSKLTQEACSSDPTAVLQEQNTGTCDALKDRTSSFGGCLDGKTFTYIVASCVEGDLSIQRNTEQCETAFPGYSFCSSCDSIQICSADQKTCEDLGMHSSGQDPFIHTYPSLQDPPIPTTPETLDDSIDCASVRPNVNYYVEECFNNTHVKLSQGECVDGQKVGRETVLQSCQEYGEDMSRQYCHHCDDHVVCSNAYSIGSVCAMTATEADIEGAEFKRDLPICVNSANQLSGAFGCVDDEIFSALFQSCSAGQFTAERNAFRCSDSFPGYSYCNTCGRVNVCAKEKQTSCEGLV